MGRALAITPVAALGLWLPACSSDGQGVQPTNGPQQDASEQDGAAQDGPALDVTQKDAPVADGDTGAAIVDVKQEDDDLRPRLDVKIRGEGGHVVSTPAGMDCTSTCSGHFDSGTKVTLKTQSGAGYWFGGWLGDCSGTGTCAVTMGVSHAVSASFFLDEPPWDPSVGSSDCLAAWGGDGQSLSSCDKVHDDYVVVNKSKRNLALCKNGTNAQSFRIGLGFGPTGDKVQQGDGKTPEGVFYISALVPDSSFHKAFLLSYPDKQDAERGAADGLIGSDDQAAIDTAQQACGEPPSSTELGGEIEIHGGTGSTDWTAGCVAIEDSEIDMLWSVLEQGDTVVIVP